MRARLSLLVAVAVLPAALWALLPMGTLGATREERLQQRIDRTEAKISSRKGKESVLTTQVSAWNRKIRGLQGSINNLQSREDVIQADLDDATRVLNRTQAELRRQRSLQVQLQARLAEGRRVLGARLVELYRADDPDLVTVILSSKGFAELLERGEFLRRISEQDQRVITLVRSARVKATMTANRLDVLEKRQQTVALRIKERRDEVAAVKARIVRVQDGYAEVRGQRAAALAAVRSDRRRLEGALSKMVAVQQRITGVLNGAPAGPIRKGTGSMIWPVNGPITSPFCERRSWESCHPGIDIGVPSGTPIRAADSGRVALAAPTSGYGNYTCIQHSASLSTCYAHQSRFAASVGQNVSKGQVIGYVGCTGFCFGDHLHFEVRINGAVTNPMNYL
ncbi:MAG: murein hydrolase activator EnvC family protein [Solirubrobacterales bacterium]